MNVALIDYGAGNISSVCKALELAGTRPILVEDKSGLQRGLPIVLPGQGAFDEAVKALKLRGLFKQVKNAIISGTPYLGICVGMQLFAERSDEGGASGWGLMPVNVLQFSDDLRVPHMGWNMTCPEWTREDAEVLFAGWPREGAWTYFAHSYFLPPIQNTIALTQYGNEQFSSAVSCHNAFGVQFHPEKSSERGFALIKNFVEFAKDNMKEG